MSARKNWMKNPLGFSLLELMVVVAILGVLATVAVPRFNIFRARSRQAEAKSNLGMIFTLQESFSIEHERYYDGNAGSWGGTDMSSAAERDGYFAAGVSKCAETDANNKIGFRLANCEKARYGYYISAANEEGFLAIAYAPSDVVGDKRIFPGCSGNEPPTPKAPNTAGATSIQGKCDLSKNGYGSGNDEFPNGDAWCLEEARNLFNYRDITEFCDN